MSRLNTYLPHPFISKICSGPLIFSWNQGTSHKGPSSVSDLRWQRKWHVNKLKSDTKHHVSMATDSLWNWYLRRQPLSLIKIILVWNIKSMIVYWNFEHYCEEMPFLFWPMCILRFLAKNIFVIFKPDFLLSYVPVWEESPNTAPTAATNVKQVVLSPPESKDKDAISAQLIHPARRKDPLVIFFLLYVCTFREILSWQIWKHGNFSF